jgi:hypothetical protein
LVHAPVGGSVVVVVVVVVDTVVVVVSRVVVVVVVPDPLPIAQVLNAGIQLASIHEIQPGACWLSAHCPAQFKNPHSAESPQQSAQPGVRPVAATTQFVMH